MIQMIFIIWVYTKYDQQIAIYYTDFIKINFLRLTDLRDMLNEVHWTMIFLIFDFVQVIHIKSSFCDEQFVILGRKKATGIMTMTLNLGDSRSYFVPMAD